MRAYTRISDHAINIHSSVTNPDIVVVIDPTILDATDVTDGLPKDGILVVNTDKTPKEIRDKTNAWKENYRFWKVVKIWPKGKYTTSPPSSGGTPWPDSSQKNRAQKFYEPVNPLTRQVVEGKVLITNQNIGNKHDERIFFRPMSRTHRSNI